MMKVCPFVCILVLTVCTASAQVKDTAKAKKKSSWVAGLAYQSDDVYLGRRDSVAVPYLTPSFGYHDKSGFFATASVAYLPASGQNRIDAGLLEAGYAYQGDQVNVEVSATKTFYSDQSFAVSSGIGGWVSTHFSYDFGPVEPGVDLNLDFSDKIDPVVSLGLTHSFSLIEGQLEIDPAAHANLASQNYYANYYSKRRYSSKRKSGNVMASIGNPSKFQVMDYEFEAPVELTLQKKWKFTFTPTLALPVNPATVTLVTHGNGGASTTQTSTESLSDVFFFSVGVTYTL